MLAIAAAQLEGAPFRLHGRDPAAGLDCIGVLAAALAACGQAADFPTGYPLRLSRAEGWIPDPRQLGFCPATPPYAAGDVVMLNLGAGQYHLAIADADQGWIHAHIGLRRVVRTPTLPAGEIAYHWRHQTEG